MVGLNKISDGYVDLVVTSPPYFNAREYSNWSSIDTYMNDMENIFLECKRVLKNYGIMVVNISDTITSPDGRKSTTRKYPLGAYFTIMLEKIGLVYIDDIIWDKGEVQSKRHFVGEPYPHQKYPFNSYEHLLIFRKFENDDIIPNCPLCNENIAVKNGIVQNTHTYECKNPKCAKSKTGRGKRYSTRQLIKNKYEIDENRIPDEFLKQFRKDIVSFSPVIKINSKSENKARHSAPYPILIPEFAIRFFSGVNDVILDPFLGSGTTAIACLKTNRQYLGYELNEYYYKVSKERIKNYKKGF